MTTRISKAGKPWREPVRSPQGGRTLHLWMNTALQASVEAAAEREGLPASTLATRILKAHFGLG